MKPKQPYTVLEDGKVFFVSQEAVDVAKAGAGYLLRYFGNEILSLREYNARFARLIAVVADISSLNRIV